MTGRPRQTRGAARRERKQAELAAEVAAALADLEEINRKAMILDGCRYDPPPMRVSLIRIWWARIRIAGARLRGQ